ncbi:MAG: cytochrome c biogenesis heme-transporting ATPase CcmA [Gammaproteobacteria bacterium]|nr:MAG: cytochrome c biogenesis heme-transporting ATPase CcmA [Gammaproteobacteria bacterium]
MSDTPLLEISNLACIRDDRVLFEHVSLSLIAGQMLLVEGPNGSGKTSLLRIITGLKLADEGEVLWQGKSIQQLTADYYEQINYVGHHDGVKRGLTCLENLRLVQAMGKPSALDLDTALEQVNLYRYGDTEVRNLSAGQKRRLALARLLVTESELWILDEPFTSLDQASMKLFKSLFERHLQDRGLIVMTSHHVIEMPEAQVKHLELGE